tara:strand:+ start:2442 stop:4469 length:2028 start_codon:yes stop_codon:yes gene_type:complete
MKYRVSADIGGTFTDIVIEDSKKKNIFTSKVLSTPKNPAFAVLDGLKKKINNFNQINFLVHGTTVGLNAFLERKGSRVLLIMTSGISDTYTIARGDRKTLYDVQYRKPKQLVSRKDVHEVKERMSWEGKIIEKIDKKSFVSIIKKIKNENIKAVAICFLHSYLNPSHEIQAKRILKKELKKDIIISLSHEIAREWREYERSSTAVMNAYIGPIVNNYLIRLENELLEKGYSKTLYVMQSNGGVIRAKTAIENPVHTLLSGPVGGTIGGAALSKIIKKPNLICVDMGGTSFDMSLIINGRPKITNETEQESLPLLIPFVDIHTIGAGGGSIAWLEAGALRVGPQSAGADPGPACYGKGGLEPTVTDANLFLGRIGSDSKLGGWMQLDSTSSEKVIRNMAKKLSMTKVELAEGILSIINAKMADAIRTITIKNGIDPREFSLVAFGGAGSMHAIWIAEELEIKEIIVPPNPGNFSAWGMLQTDIRRDLTKNYFTILSETKKSNLKKFFNELIDEASNLLKSEGVSNKKMLFYRTADMRYIGQEYYVNISIDSLLNLNKINSDFHNTYKKTFGHSTPDAPVEIINLRLVAIGLVDRVIDYSKINNQKTTKRVNIKKREVIFNNVKHLTNIINRNSIKLKDRLNGPLIIEEESATTVVSPKYFVNKDLMGNLIIKRKNK